MGDEGGKNADSKSISNPLELDPLDDIPTPTMMDFDDGVGEEERRYYLEKFHDLKNVRRSRLHCTACDKHLGLLTRHMNRYRMHPMLKTLVCISCQDFYNSGEFSKGEDGSELFCRWCGQGGQVYCCSSCPIVFCEKCIKRNFGMPKIIEIESNDDWLCFSCDPKPLWLLRAKFWVLIIYCTFKNSQAQNCPDAMLKATLLRRSQVDETECCKKNTMRRAIPPVVDKRKQSEPKKAIIDNRPIVPTPEQKKSLSINEARQAIKRLGSPVSIKKVTVTTNQTNPPQGGPVPLKMNIPSIPSHMQLAAAAAAAKRARLNPPPPQMTPRFPLPAIIRTPQDNKKPMPQPIRKPPAPPSMFNGYSLAQGLTPGMREAYASVISNDSLNLSLDSLTQGIDLTNIAQLEAAALAQEAEENECEEEEVSSSANNSKDDDVQCLTPTPKLVPKPASAPPPRSFPASLPSSAFNNIIQMTENDVTINEVTGGLKFKVDPSTLSSSKMYKLPDGRIFAVNHNPNMPGGYSATIVAVDEASLRSGAPPPRGRVPPRLTPRQQAMNKPQPTPTPPKPQPTWNSTSKMTTRSKVATRTSSGVDPSTVIAGSVEWFKFNIVDAIDVMNYVVQKLHRLKNSSPDLRSKNVAEIKELHQNFDQLLKTSCKRFSEVKDNLNQGFKTWLKEKNCSELYSDDEDDIQILPDDDTSSGKGSRRNIRKGKISNNEPIFIDENSNDSTKNTDKDDDAQGENSDTSQVVDGKKKKESKPAEVKKEDDAKETEETKQSEDNKDVSDKTQEHNDNAEQNGESQADKTEQSKDDKDKPVEENEDNKQTNNDSSHTDEEMPGEDESKDHSMEETGAPSSDKETDSNKVIANGKCENTKSDEAVDANSKTGDDSLGEEMIDMLLDDTNNADKDVDMESDDLHNSLSNLGGDSESRDNTDEPQ